MHWTDERPVVNGYYWLREHRREGSYDSIVEFNDGAIMATGDEIPEYLDDIYAINVVGFGHKLEWCGPLTVPEG